MGVPTTQPTLILQPFANAGNIQIVPQTDPSAFVNFSQGYTPDYEINLASGNPAAKAVERPIMNWMFQLLTSNVQWWQDLGFSPWYNTMPGGYSINSCVMRQGSDGNYKPYRSLANSNVTDPLSSTTWEYIQFPHEILSNIPMPQGGSNGSGSAIITAATDFNTIGTGTFQTASDAVAASCPNAPAVLGQSSLAGLLQSMNWTIGANTFGAQLYMDRTSQIFVRGMTNGSWANWRNLFAAPNVYVVGEIRTWSGTATQAAVTAAWGPGWHLCDGTLGTVDLRGRFIVGQGQMPGTGNPAFAVGQTGGAYNVTITTAQLPAHAHPAAVNDPGHTHTISQSPHGHPVSDPGHNHAVGDPGHSHGVNDPGHNHYVNDPGHSHSQNKNASSQAGSDNGGMPASTDQPYYSTGRNFLNTNPSGTGIWLNGAYTGIYLSGSGTGIYLGASATNIGIVAVNANVSNVANTTGIQVTTSNTGGGGAVNVQNPFYALCFVQYTGA